jgi:hypothetical protein
MRLTDAVLCVVIAGVFTAEAQTADKNQTIVTLDQGPAYEATSQDSRWVARIFVTPAQPGDGKGIAAEIKGVSSGARSDPGLSAMFDSPHPVLDGGRLTSFDVSTKKAMDIPHGTYNVLLTFSSGEARQLSTIQFTIPAAVLAPAHLLITRVLPLLGAASGDHPTLVLRETGGRSPAKVQFSQDRFSDANGEYGGQLVLPVVTVPEGQQALVTYNTQGDFPLGTAKANLTLLSHQLDSPATVAVEVRTRRTRILLMLLVATGLLLGFLMRTVLKQQIQFGEARQLAIDEFNKLRQERDAASDDDYRAVLERAMTPLAHAIEAARASRVSDLSVAITAAEAALKAAEDGLKASTDEASATLKAVAEVVETRWRVPEPAASQLRVSQAGLAAVRGALARGNVAEARHGLDTVVESLSSSIESTVRPYRASYEGFIGDLAPVGALLLPEAQDDFQAAVKQLNDLGRAMPDVAPGDGIANLKTLLGAISQAGSAVESLLANLGVKVVQTFAAMNDELSPVPLPEPAAWSSAEAETRRFGAWLADVASDLARNSPDMRQRAGGLRRGWWTALSVQAADPKAAGELFKQGKYGDAAEAIADTIRGGPKEKLLGVMASPVVADGTDADGGAAPPWVVPRTVERPDLAFERPYQPRRASGTIQAIETRTFHELIAAKFVQWIISAVGLTFVGYLLFADKFVGTAPELLTGFFWGFTTDVGLDALISAGKPKAAG